ncbi:MAG: hypothetical protein AB1428_12185 [Bacteroidota bacterium]
MKIGHQSPATKEYIRVAERYIQEKEYDLAMKQLAIAQKLEPDNIYIHAIVERIHRLAAEESNGGRFLSITVGDEFEGGIKSNGNGGPQPDEIETQVKRLTSKATELLRRGAYETAFDSLMNAYLLDPVSPYVIETERTLLPAIEMMRKAKKEGSQRLAAANGQSPSARRPATSMLSPEDSQRLEELMRQKELEREDRERALWREASRPPKILEGLLPPDPPKMELDPIPPAAPQKEHSGFFAKLKHGKFLG